MGLTAFLDRVLSGLLPGLRVRSAAALFRRAERLRREGRYDEAGALVDEGLRRSPQSAAGHLLAGYLHLASRRVGPAREAFQSVLALDPDHPRALLGLAQIAIEEGDTDGARPYLDRALQYHPDFPEARAIEEMAATGSAGRADASLPARAAEGLPAPPGWRDAMLARLDGGVVFSECDAAREPAVARHVTQVARVAGATLARAGLGVLRRGVIESAHGATYLQADVGLVLALTLPAGTAIADGFGRLGRLWAEKARTAREAHG